MNERSRISIRRNLLIVCIATVVVILILCLTVQAMPDREQFDKAILITMTPTPVFSAAMTIIPSQRQLAIGETLVVTVAISVSTGCFYPVHDLALQQYGNDAPTLDYLSPPTHTVGPPVSNPFSYTLTAINTGTVVLRGLAYGERYCGDYWNWLYISGDSQIIRVGEWPYRTYLPVIHEQPPPYRL